MATITLGNSYRFKDYNNNKYLNILVNGNPANNSNVTIYSLDSADMGQVWKCDHHSGANVSGVLMKSAKDTSFALDRWRGSSNYNNADVYKIGTTDADLQDQLVEFLPISNGYYRIKLVYADLYLTVSATTAYGGYNVNWQAITGNADQLWAAELYSVSSSATPEPTPTAIKDKEFFVKAYGTNLNLNVYGTDTVANARNVNAYEKEDCLAQRWIAKQTSAGPKLFTKINQSYALNINTADNNCTMYTAAGNDNDSVLEFEEAGDMLYRIKMFKYGKYLTVNGSTSGSNVIWSDYVTTATLWEFIPEDVMFPSAPKAPDAPEGIVGNTYAVQANGTDFYLNVYGTDTVADGRNVNIYNKDDCLAQRWFIKNTDNGPKLFTKVNEEVGYTLNIYTTDDNCTMYTDSTENDADSILEFISVGNMLYRIKMYHHDKYLCIDGAATSGANVKWISGASSATVWKLVPEATAFPTPASAPATIVGKTFFIKNYNTGYNLNVHGTNTVALGRNVNVFAKEPEDSQRWQVIQTPKGPKIITEINPDFALNIHVENNNNCVMYDIDDNNADSVIEFVPYDEDKNIYKLKMFHHNKYLEAAGVGSGFNAYWSDSPVYNLWQFVEEDDMFPPVEDAPADIADKVFFIQNVNTGHFLNVHGTNTVANTRNVNVYAKENANAQRWIIRNKDGGPKLVTKIDETFAVNIYANDNNCTMYKEDGNDIDSVLQFIPYTTGQTAAEDDVYRIKMHYHNRYLTVSNTNIGANAWWTSVDSEPYALWKLIPESEMTFDGVTDTDTTPDSSLVSVFMPAHSNNYMVGRAGNQISEITIHHTAAVASSVERIGDDWQNPERGASSHYCVRGTRVGQFVKECNTAYTNGGSLKKPEAGNPNVKAVTIETCNSTGDPTWEVSDDTYYTLVRLVADIARRNNLGTLVVGQNLKTHQDHAYTICPGPYLLARMQDIADRANKINNATYIRKHNTSLYLGVNSNNEIIWTDRDGAKGWDMVESGSKYVFRDINDSSKILQIAEDGETPILSDATNSSMQVYGTRNTDGFINIFAESLLRSSSTLLSLAAFNFGLPAFTVYAADNLTEIETDSNSTTENTTNTSFKDRVFRMKCTIPESGATYYLTAAADSEFHPAGNGISVSLNSYIESDEKQYWKVKCFPNGWYGLSSIAYPNYYLELDPKSNAAVINDRNVLNFLTLNEFEIPEDYAYEFNNTIINISPVAASEDKYIIELPMHNKKLSYYPTTTSSFASWLDQSALYWELEEPEPKLLKGWLRAYYNPQDKYEEDQVTYIPNYAFYLPVSYFNNQEDPELYTFDCIEKYKISNTEYTTNPQTYYIKDYYIYGDNLYVTSFEAHTKNNEYNKKLVTLKFDDPNIWAAVGNYTKISDEVNIGLYGKINDPDSNLFIDNNGYYWIAVGPKVVKKDILPSEQPGYDYYNAGTVDAMIADDEGRKYYIHCAIGDIKAHTWNNGVFQSGIAYQNPGTENSCHDLATNRFYESTISDGWGYETFSNKACVEFIGNIKNVNYDFISRNEEFYKYHIEGMIFYPFNRS